MKRILYKIAKKMRVLLVNKIATKTMDKMMNKIKKNSLTRIKTS